MSTSMVWSLLFVMVFTASAAAQQGTSTSPAGSPADRLAARSLSYQARSLWYQRSGSGVSRVRRTLVLLQFARRLSPSDPVVNRQLVDLYESLGRLKDASRAAAVYLDSYPDDYAMALRWIRLTLAGLNTAEERINFLEKVVESKSLCKSARASATVELMFIYQGQGKPREVEGACRKALALDPYQPVAMRKLLELSGNKDAIRVFRLGLDEFRGNPRSLYSSISIAQSLRSAGVYDKALIFYKHALTIARDIKPDDATMLNLLVGYFNAMLDAGRVKEAVEKFKPYVKKYNGSLKLHALMVEAYRALGQDAQADVHVKAMQRIYLPITLPGASRSGIQSAELAWFNLMFRSDAITALRWAREAARSAGDNPFVQRCLGAAEIAAGKINSGVRRLKSLLGKDAYAAVILARYYFEHDKVEDGKRVLLDGLGDIRTNPAWRAANRLAALHNVKFPPDKQAQPMRKAVDELPGYLFVMGQHPERFVKVRLTAPRPTVRLGEPIFLEVSIENTSERTIALGQRGLFCPTVFLTIEIDGDEKLSQPDLIPVAIPCPKYFGPGKKVSTRVRIDAGRAGKVLFENPFADVKIIVSGKVDLLELGGKLFTSVPGVKVAAVRVVRSAVIKRDSDEKSARYALGRIVRDLKRGTLAQKVRAAWQCASLLGYIRRVERAKTRPVFSSVITKPILLSMTRAFLQTDEPVVRAEMLLALQNVDLDSQIISLMGRCIEDPSPLVRMRLIELLVVKKTRGYKTILSYLSYDRDELVKAMIKALAGQK